jgi:hypothetical protein
MVEEPVVSPQAEPSLPGKTQEAKPAKAASPVPVASKANAEEDDAVPAGKHSCVHACMPVLLGGPRPPTHDTRVLEQRPASYKKKTRVSI